MTLYVMDTDHISLIERGYPSIRNRIVVAEKRSDRVFTTVVSVEEQFAGRISQIRRVRDPERLGLAYRRLKGTFALFADLDVLDYDAAADERFRELRKVGIRIGTQDLRIASIVLSNEGILLTRNLRDFEKVPGLMTQDWSVEP